MIRTYLIATVISLMLAILSGIYWIGGRAAREAERELQHQIDTEERTNAADPDFSTCGWHDRLRGDCE